MNKKYTNLPKILTRKDYDVVTKKIAHTLEKVSGVYGVYLLGDSWKPGISDIDLLVICQKNSRASLRSPWSFGEPAKYIFTHRYLSMEKMTARKLFYLFPPETLSTRLIAGNGINFDNPSQTLSPEEYRDLVACVFFDMLINKLLPLTGAMTIGKKIDVRSRIGALYSLFYSEAMLKLLCGYEIPTHLRERIISLRGEWFNRTTEENLVILGEVSNESIVLIMDMVQKFTEYTRAQYPIIPAFRFFNQRYTLSFSSNWTSEQFLRKYSLVHLHVLFGNSKFEHDMLFLPSELSIYLAWYASGTGIFSTQVRKVCEEIVKQDIPTGVKAHLEALDVAFEDYSRNDGIHKIPYTYGFRPITSYWRNLIGWWILVLWRFRL